MEVETKHDAPAPSAEGYIINRFEISYRPNVDREIHEVLGHRAYYVDSNANEAWFRLKIRSSSAKHHCTLGWIHRTEGLLALSGASASVLRSFQQAIWKVTAKANPKDRRYKDSAVVFFKVEKTRESTTWIAKLGLLMANVERNLLSNPDIANIIGTERGTRFDLMKGSRVNYPNQYRIKGIPLENA